MNKIIKPLILTVCIISLLIFSGCGFDGQPRPRVGSYPASKMGAKFKDPDSLGSHSYGLVTSFTENNGLVYTANGGHIDIAHLRIAADNVRSLYNKSRTSLLKGQEEFTFKLNVESSRYYVSIAYPDYWQSLSPDFKEKIADKMALDLSQYCTYTMTTWHEVLTWFGYKCLFFLPEKSSAFSWEDIYSNLLGTRLGAQAVVNNQYGYDKAMTVLLGRELDDLGAQPKSIAKRAGNEMKEKIFNGGEYLDRTRSLDIGLDDGLVTPVLVDGICPDAQPKAIPVPTLASLKKYGFTVKVEIEPKEFETGKILKIIYPNGGQKRISPAEHLPIVMDFITKDAIAKGFAVTPATRTVAAEALPVSKVKYTAKRSKF